MNIDMSKRFAIIEKDIQNGIFLFGAGTNGAWCLDYANRIGLNVIAFIDKDVRLQGTMICEKKVISYEEYVRCGGGGILVTAKRKASEIMNEYADNIKIMPFDSWYIIKNKKDFDNFEFYDEKSYRVLEMIKKCMYYNDNEYLYGETELGINQYFAIAPFMYSSPEETYVDLGAFTGDTIERFINTNTGSFKRIYAFEPGVAQSIALQKRCKRLIEEWALDKESIVHIPKAVSSENGKMFLRQEGILLSSMQVLDSENGNSIDVVKLDDCLQNENVTFLKADIEGCEYEMLVGAEQLVKRCKPKMAICVYHKPDDLFRIYHLVKKLNPGYHFALRQHASTLLETVLYCWV